MSEPKLLRVTVNICAQCVDDDDVMFTPSCSTPGCYFNVKNEGVPIFPLRSSILAEGGTIESPEDDHKP